MWILKLDKSEMKFQFCHYQICDLKKLTPVSLSFCSFIIGIIHCLLNMDLRDYYVLANTVNSGNASMNKTKTLTYGGGVN